MVPFWAFFVDSYSYSVPSDWRFCPFFQSVWRQQTSQSSGAQASHHPLLLILLTCRILHHIELNSSKLDKIRLELARAAIREPRQNTVYLCFATRNQTLFLVANPSCFRFPFSNWNYFYRPSLQIVCFLCNLLGGWQHRPQGQRDTGTCNPISWAGKLWSVFGKGLHRSVVASMGESWSPSHLRRHR